MHVWRLCDFGILHVSIIEAIVSFFWISVYWGKLILFQHTEEVIYANGNTIFSPKILIWNGGSCVMIPGEVQQAVAASSSPPVHFWQPTDSQISWNTNTNIFTELRWGQGKKNIRMVVAINPWCSGDSSDAEMILCRQFNWWWWIWYF